MATIEGKDNPKDTGPTWHDVYDLMRNIEQFWDSRVTISTTSTTTVANRYGLYLKASLAHYPTRAGYGNYGPAYPGSAQKTMASAYWHALTRLEIDMTRLDMPPAPRTGELPLPSDDDTPF